MGQMAGEIPRDVDDINSPPAAPAHFLSDLIRIHRGVLVVATTQGHISIFAPLAPSETADDECPTVLCIGHEVLPDGILSVTPIEGSVVALGCMDAQVHLCDYMELKVLSSLEGHAHWIRDVAFLSTRRILASGSEDSDIRLWKLSEDHLQESESLGSLTDHSDHVQAIRIREDRLPDRLLSASADRTARIWDLEKMATIGVLEGHRGQLLAIDAAPGGDLIATGSADRTLKLWDVSSSEESASVSQDEMVASLFISADHEDMLVTGSPSCVSLYDRRNLSETVQKWESAGNSCCEINGDCFGKIGKHSCSVFSYETPDVLRDWEVDGCAVGSICYVPSRK